MAETATPSAAGQSSGQEGTTEQVKDKAQEMAGEAKQQARQVTSRAQDQARTRLDQKSTEAGDRVHGTAGDVRAVAEELRKQGKEQPAKVAEQAAERAERLGSYLKESDADRMLRDAEQFARQRPWAVVAGGLALGFVASRFLKASSTERYRTSLDTPARTEGVRTLGANDTGTEMAPATGFGVPGPGAPTV